MMEVDAYGFLGLKPWEYYRLTPYEFQRMLEAKAKEQNTRVRREAGWVSTIVNFVGHPDEPITVDRLLGTGTESAEHKAEENERLLKRAQARRLQRIKEREERERGANAR